MKFSFTHLSYFLLITIVFVGCSRGVLIQDGVSCRCTPGDHCWPEASEWVDLAEQVEGRLLQPVSHIQGCINDADSAECATELEQAQNPFFLEATVGASQTTGWHKGWTSAPSAYAVQAENTSDIVAAVNFARNHNLKLAIKGTGHDYLGRSSDPDALMVWTHRMRDIELHDQFKPVGCGTEVLPVTAASFGAGTRWLEAYREVTTKNGRYVQGGGCTTVGVAGGFTQGGGFGSFSRKYGTGAAGIVEVEVVTADGKVHVANECQNEDLFWAIRGGGGGTFGVVTRMTLLTHDLPEHAGVFQGNIKAESDTAYQELLAYFLPFARENLVNEHWGEQLALGPDNTLGVYMVFQGLTEEEAHQTWAPVKEFVNQHDHLSYTADVIMIPPQSLWDYDFWSTNHPDMIHVDNRPGQPEGQFWYASNQAEVSFYWYTYQSRYLPASKFEESEAEQFAKVLYDTSRIHPFTIQINKGLADSSADSLVRGSKTSVNPVVYQSAALVIMAAGKSGVYPEVTGHGPDSEEAEKKVAQVNRAMEILRNATPDSGSYANEADYFEPNWKDEFWGVNYDRLLEVKKRYDPSNLFWCHHCVGSDYRSADGRCRR